MVEQGSFLAACSARLQGSGIRLRPALEADLLLLADIYATTRVRELEAVAWTPGQKKAFTDSQSRAQEQHYANHFPSAERFVIERDSGEAIGRIYVETTPTEVRLMEITLYPAQRNHGIGTRLMEALLRYTDARGAKATLYVEPENPARRMYVRMGFEGRETEGFYQRMERPAVS